MKKVVLLLVVAASVAHGEIYTWTDSGGAAHYTNRKDEIPVRYRPGARSLNYGEETQGGTPSREQNVLQQSAPVPPGTPSPNAVGPAQGETPSLGPNVSPEQLQKQREGRRGRSKRSREREEE